MQDQPFQETLDQNVQVYLVEKDPESYAEAMASYDAPFWREAIDDEMHSIMSNNT